MCSSECARNRCHVECEMFEKFRIAAKVNGYGDVERHLHGVVPLRCLLLKTNPDKWSKLTRMQSQNDIRAKIADLWANNEKWVVTLIRNDWGMAYTDVEIHTVCGILEVNAFQIGPSDSNLRGVYPTAFLLSHNCVPNTVHSDEPKTFRLTIRASTCVEKGEAICISYAHTLQNTQQRREYLEQNKFFKCTCDRCSDPTELTTYMGALKCPKCAGGYLFDENPLNNDITWKCMDLQRAKNRRLSNGCGYAINRDNVNRLNERLSNEIETIAANDIKSLETLLEKYRNVLHQNHQHCVTIKHRLSQLYGKIDGFLINQLPESLLLRKIHLCKDLLKVFDVIEPGASRLRGVTLYELHAPLMVLASRQFEKCTITKNALRLRLKEVIRCLDEAHAILSLESPGSVEFDLARAALAAVGDIRKLQKV